MELGKYLDDAKKMIGLAGPLIREGMTDEETIQAFAMFSNGVEKLLKHGLERINPLFIQRSPEFKSSAILYKDKFIPGYSGGEIDKTPDQDVITAKVSLNRLKAFSATANNYSQLLHTMIGWRDTLAHRPSSELDIDEVRSMLLKDAPRLVYSFAEELGEWPETFFGERSSTINSLSLRLVEEDRIRTRMTALLQAHALIWAKKQSNAVLSAEADRLTRAETARGGHDYHNASVPCPACGQTCLVRLTPDYDYSDGESYLAGVYPEKLYCFHCELSLEGYEEFEFVELDKLLAGSD